MLVLVISGLLGFRVGFVSFPDWQVAVETAQVLAGLVEYPPSNPFFVYHTKVWTVLHQICALLLAAGLEEATLSRLVSGLLGMVAFQSLSMVVYAFSRNAALAIGSALLVVFTRTAEYGVVYPVFLMGTTHTYGALGLSMAVLVAGLVGAGSFRTGLFLLGALPAVHPVIGAWLIAVVALAVLSVREIRLELRPALKFFLVGFCVTAVSLVIHLVWTGEVPGFRDEGTDRYLTAFAAFWDGHRQPVNFASEGVKLCAGALTLSLFALTALRESMSRAQRLLLRLIVVSGLTALALALITHLDPARLPSPLMTLMPGRFLNFDAQLAVALLCGLIALSGTGWRTALMLYLSIGLLLGNRSMLWEWLGPQGSVLPLGPTRPLQILLTVAGALLLLTVVTPWVRKRSPDAGRAAGTSRRVLRGATATMNVAIFLLLGGVALLTWQRRPEVKFLDRTNDVLFAAAARTEGFLLTAGDLHLVQLRTRRPVLLDGGGLDGLPYAPESGPELERILRDVYEIDLFNPPDAARGLGAIPNAANRAAWERFGQDKWRSIGRAYGVTAVLTFSDWTLDLPVVERNSSYVLYGVPD
jgi:hypothetical protein